MWPFFSSFFQDEGASLDEQEFSEWPSTLLVLIRELTEDAGLVMTLGRRLELVFHTDLSRPFLSLCEHAEVGVGGLKPRLPISVVEHGDHDLEQGQPFLENIKLA